MNIINVEENKNNVIKKANELIKAKGELSGTAQKMLAMLISMIRADDTEFQIYALKIDDYKKEYIGSYIEDLLTERKRKGQYQTESGSMISL